MPHALLLVLLASVAGPTPAPEAAPAPPPADNRTYFDRPLTEADVAGRSLRELAILRNTIYARAHNVFRKQWLHDYFTQFPWYRDTGVDDSLLSELDRQNAEFLDRYETGLPREELLRRKAALWARHAEPSTRASGLIYFGATPDGRRLVAAYEGGEALVLDAADGHLLRTLSYRPAGAMAVVRATLSGDGASLRAAWQTEWNSPMLWADFPLDGSPPSAPADLGLPSVRVYLPLPGDRVLVRADTSIELWDLKPTPARRWSHPWQQLQPLGDGFVTDRRGRFAAFNQHPGLRIWDLEADREEVAGAQDFYFGINEDWVLAEDGRGLYVADPQGLNRYELPAKDAQTWVSMPRLTTPSGSRRRQWGGLALAPGGTALFHWENDGLARRELPSLAMRWGVVVRPQPSDAVRWAVSPDGARVYVALAGRLDAWDAHTGQPDPSWRGPGLWTEDEAVEGMLLARALGEPVPALLAQGEERNPLDDVRLLDALLSVEQLRDLSRRDLMLLRNTIYARRGKSWKGSLQGYFGRMGWYHALPGYSDARLTALDKRNLKVVMSLEQSLGGPLPDRDDAPRRFRG